jgi:long-chain acyl-CoA synthetase
VQGYGLAETAALVAVGAPFRAGDVGRPLAGVELRLGDDGEVLVRGAGLSPGYLGAGDGALALTPDGFLATGDLGRLDARGRLVLVGRKKELIVTAEGHNVAPDDVEAALRRQGGVRDAAAVALGTGQGEEVHAALLLAPGADAAAVVRAANAELPPFQRVRGWSVWPEGDLPRGALGKPRRLEVRRRLAEAGAGAGGAASAGDAPLTLADVLAAPDRRRRLDGLAHQLATRPESLRDARLGLGDALGLGSLDVVELVGRVEQRRGALHATPVLAPGATLADLAAALEARGSARDARRPMEEPWWAASLPLRALRPLTRGLTLRLWRALAADVHSCWHTDPSALAPPLVVAAAPHRHWLDAFALFLSLPRRLRRRPLVVTDHDFSPWFAPEPGTPLGARLFSGLGYHAGLPLLFRFVILTARGRVRDGLTAAARAVDRGYSPLTFPRGLRFGAPEVQAPGAALLALETGRPLLPVHVEAADGALGLRPRRPRPRVRLHFGAPLEARAGETREQLMARLDEALDALARAAPNCARA